MTEAGKRKSPPAEEAAAGAPPSPSPSSSSSTPKVSIAAEIAAIVGPGGGVDEDRHVPKLLKLCRGAASAKLQRLIAKMIAPSSASVRALFVEGGGGGGGGAGGAGEGGLEILKGWLEKACDDAGKASEELDAALEALNNSHNSSSGGSGGSGMLADTAALAATRKKEAEDFAAAVLSALEAVPVDKPLLLASQAGRAVARAAKKKRSPGLSKALRDRAAALQEAWRAEFGAAAGSSSAAAGATGTTAPTIPSSSAAAAAAAAKRRAAPSPVTTSLREEDEDRRPTAAAAPATKRAKSGGGDNDKDDGDADGGGEDVWGGSGGADQRASSFEPASPRTAAGSAAQQQSQNQSHHPSAAEVAAAAAAQRALAVEELPEHDAPANVYGVFSGPRPSGFGHLGYLSMTVAEKAAAAAAAVPDPPPPTEAELKAKAERKAKRLAARKGGIKWAEDAALVKERHFLMRDKPEEVSKGDRFGDDADGDERMRPGSAMMGAGVAPSTPFGGVGTGIGAATPPPFPLVAGGFRIDPTTLAGAAQAPHTKG